MENSYADRPRVRSCRKADIQSLRLWIVRKSSPALGAKDSKALLGEKALALVGLYRGRNPVTEIFSQRTTRGDGRSEAYFASIQGADVLCREIIEASPDCFKVLDLNGNIEFMNRNGQCLMDIADFAAFEGRGWASLWPTDEQQKVIVALAAARAGDTARFQAFCPTAAGVPKWWDVIVYRVDDRCGNPTRLIGISRDITQAHRVQEELESLIQELRRCMELNAPAVAEAA